MVNGLDIFHRSVVYRAMAASTDLSLKDVARALDSLTVEQTKDLVVHFGVKLNVLTDIEIQYRDRCPRLHILQAWLDRDTEASWEKIVGRLKETGMNVLGQRLMMQYCPQLSTGTSSADTTKSAPGRCHPLAVAQVDIDDVRASSADTTKSASVPTMQPMISTPSPAAPTDIPPATGHAQSLVVSQGNITIVKAVILRLEKTFSNIASATRSVICDKESHYPNFLEEFRDHLFNMPVAQKAAHVKFFRESEDDILEAKNIRKIFVILSRYWNYRNYEVLEQIIIWFCDDSLQTRMQEYCTMLEEFEKATPVDVYVSAISASKSLKVAFSKMVVQIDKPSSECTLYDIRKFKEEIAEAASLRSHSVYIDGVGVHCVMVVLSFPPSALGWVLAAMTQDFMSTHHLTDVTVDGRFLTLIQAERQQLVCALNYSTVKPLLADTPNSGHLPYSRQTTMYQVFSVLKKPLNSGHLNNGHSVLHRRNYKQPPNSRHSN